MSSSWPDPGIHHVGEYQKSGNAFIVPNATTARVITLKYVSRALTFIVNTDDAVITFADETLDDAGLPAAVSRTITLKKGTHRIEIKCKGFSINDKDIAVVCELTNIPVRGDEVVIPSYALMGTIV